MTLVPPVSGRRGLIALSAVLGAVLVFAAWSWRSRPQPKASAPLPAVEKAEPRGVSALGRVSALEALPQHPYKERRDVPAWGSIFSKQVLFARLTNSEEEAWFYEDLLAFHRLFLEAVGSTFPCLLYTSPSPRDPWKSRMPSSA